jgi:hypothetical protein
MRALQAESLSRQAVSGPIGIKAIAGLTAVVALPIPFFAFTGLSLPLPSAAARIASGLVPGATSSRPASAAPVVQIRRTAAETRARSARVETPTPAPRAVERDPAPVRALSRHAPAAPVLRAPTDDLLGGQGASVDSAAAMPAASHGLSMNAVLDPGGARTTNAVGAGSTRADAVSGGSGGSGSPSPEPPRGQPLALVSSEGDRTAPARENEVTTRSLAGTTGAAPATKEAETEAMTDTAWQEADAAAKQKAEAEKLAALKAAEDARKQAEEAAKQQAEAAKKAAEDAKTQTEEAAKQQVETAKKAAEAAKKAAEDAKTQAEEAAKLKAEAEKKAAEEAKKQAEEAAKQQAEAAKKAAEEAKTQAAAAAKQQAEAAKAAAEAALKTATSGSTAG